MRADYSLKEDLPSLPFGETTYAATSDPGPASIQTQDHALDLTLKRKDRKRHKKRERNLRLTKSKLFLCQDDKSVKGKDVILDGFGNCIADNTQPQSCGDNASTDDQVKDFAWVFSEGDDVSSTSDFQDQHSSLPKEHGLSQNEYCQWDKGTHNSSLNNFESERSAIEEEIKRKCLEMDKLLAKITAKRQRRSRRLQRLQYVEDNCDMAECVHIEPIKRQKRIAQPIRNALLIRSSMRKAWKGVLGSCCGRGCWAKWKWMNLKRVICDYE